MEDEQWGFSKYQVASLKTMEKNNSTTLRRTMEDDENILMWHVPCSKKTLKESKIRLLASLPTDKLNSQQCQQCIYFLRKNLLDDEMCIIY